MRQTLHSTVMTLALAAVVAGSVLATSSPPAYEERYPKLAPYVAIRWSDQTPEVRLAGDEDWLRLESIDGHAVSEIVAFARKTYGDRWQKRFDEDLVQVLTEMGHPPDETVALILRESRTDSKRTLDRVPMTEDNRDAIMAFKRAAAGSSRRPPAAGPGPDDLRVALDAFEKALDERWAYRHANGADFAGPIAALRSRIGSSGLSPNDFGIELMKILALGIDGHSEVSGYRLPSPGFLPFLVEPVGDGYVAFRPDRDAFLADGFPYVTRIDGKPLAEWCEVAKPLVPKGSPQFVRRQCLRLLREIGYLRHLLRVEASDRVEVELRSEHGARRKTVTLPMSRDYPLYGRWPREGSSLLDGNIGYLRLADMDRAVSVKEIETWMPRFRDTVGLVVDVRDNGGGARDALRLLYSWLAAPDDPPRVINTAVYRRHRSLREDHLSHRFMYRADAREWTAAERRAIEEFRKTFEPEWVPPPGDFSDWHYLVLSRLDDATIPHDAKPVVVLMNAKCFSATDIFLAGLKGMKDVTLMGGPSSGGSAFSLRLPLGPTPFMLRIGSMASFQVDGKLFDGHGVAPDVVVEPEPEDFIDGGSDTVLKKAIERIAKQRGGS